MPPRLLTLLAIALPLAACLPTTSEPVMPDPATAPNTRTVPYRKTPHPQRGYIITLRLDGAPGPFASMKGFAHYQISDRSCLPPRDPFTGAQHMISRYKLETTWTRVSESVFTTTIYADGMEDADYFGEGVCRWKLTYVTARLRATGDLVETRFVPTIEADSIMVQGEEKLYFWSGYYPRAKNSEGFADFGQADLDRVPHDKRNEFFTITMSSKEVTP